MNLKPTVIWQTARVWTDGLTCVPFTLHYFVNHLNSGEENADQHFQEPFCVKTDPKTQNLIIWNESSKFPMN